MVRFLLGEDKYVRFLIHSTVDERFVIKEANWRLLLNGKEESSGMCDVEQKDDSWEISSKISPMRVSSYYKLELKVKIRDEIIMHREDVEVR